LKAAGLSIEGSKIRASFVGKRLGVIKPLGTDELALPSEPAERAAALTEALGKWKSAYGIHGVAVGLGLSHFSHRIIELPLRSKEDIRNALRFEMEKFLPLEPDLYSIDFHTIESTAEGTRNLVLALRKEKVRWIADCLGEAGIGFLGVRCTALEAANELFESSGVSETVMVHPWEGAYHIVGIKDSQPEVLKLAESKEEALREVSRLSDSLGKTVHVVGDSASSEFERFAPRRLSSNMPHALALSALKRKRVAVNLVPEELAPQRKDYYPLAIGILCAACVAVFFATSVMAYLKDYRALTEVQSRIAEIKASTREITETNREIEANLERLNFLYGFRNSKNRNIRVVSELSGLLPKNAWLVSLSADENGKVEIEGFAERAADIIGPIEGSPLFKDVEFASPVTVREGIERFSLKMQIEEQ